MISEPGKNAITKFQEKGDEQKSESMQGERKCAQLIL